MAAYNRTTLQRQPRHLSREEREDLLAGCGGDLTPGQRSLLQATLLSDDWLTDFELEALGPIHKYPRRP